MYGEESMREIARYIDRYESSIQRKLDRGDLTHEEIELIKLRGDQIARKTKLLEIMIRENRA